jgi:hypothetical protein
MKALQNDQGFVKKVYDFLINMIANLQKEMVSFKGY